MGYIVVDNIGNITSFSEEQNNSEGIYIGNLSKGGSPYFKPHELRFITGNDLLKRVTQESPYADDWKNITPDYNIYI